jgi:hypothetical protein
VEEPQAGGGSKQGQPVGPGKCQRHPCRHGVGVARLSHSNPADLGGLVQWVSRIGRQSIREPVERLVEAPQRPSKRSQQPRRKARANDEAGSCHLPYSLRWSRGLVRFAGCPPGAEAVLRDQCHDHLTRGPYPFPVAICYSRRPPGSLHPLPAIAGEGAAWNSPGVPPARIGVSTCMLSSIATIRCDSNSRIPSPAKSQISHICFGTSCPNANTWPVPGQRRSSGRCSPRQLARPYPPSAERMALLPHGGLAPTCSAALSWSGNGAASAPRAVACPTRIQIPARRSMRSRRGSAPSAAVATRTAPASPSSG